MRLFVTLVVLVAACGDDDSGSRAQGELGGVCYPNGTCNVTLFCENGLCRAFDGGLLGDGSLGDGAPGDSNNTCADDSALEPNETTGTAWVTPVDSTKNFPIAGLAICPAGDKDVYSLTITTTGEDLEVIVTYEAAAPALQASILNAGGTALVNAAATGTPRTIRAFTSNLPTGTYFVRVQGGTNDTNNYSMTINVTGP